MKKAIIFPRVSTEQQSYEEQKKELINMAFADGYSQRQLVIIENKESAIKLDEEHREGIVDMKHCIETDKNIDCVYIWEVSRWARKKYILFNLEHYLVERKIQLKVKNPSIVLLDENNELNANADWMFTIFAQLAETEMTLKIERFKRAKRERKREGYKIGGKISFGYYADETKKIHISNTEAEIVRKIFKLYHTHSISQICDEIKKFGYNFTHKRVNLILKNRAYISSLKDKDGLPVFYPRILTDEEFNEVQSLLEKNKKQCKERLYSPCARLIVCPECGRHFLRVGRDYKCSMKNHRNAYANKECFCNITLSANNIDKLVIDIAQSAQVKDLKNKSKDEKKELKQSLKETRKKREVIEKKLQGIDSKKKKLAKIYLDDEIINDKEYQRRLNKIKEETIILEQEMSYLIQKELTDTDKLNNYQVEKMSIKDVNKLDAQIKNQKLSAEDIYGLTHKYIKEIKVRRLKGDKSPKAIEIITTNGIIWRYMFSGVGRGFNIKTSSELEMYNKPFNELVVSDFIEPI